MNTRPLARGQFISVRTTENIRPWASITPRAPPPPQLNKMGIIRKLRVSTLRY